MRGKRDVFFVNNLNFQLLMALIVSRMLDLSKDNTLLLVNTEIGSDRSIEAIERHFTLSQDVDEEYGTAYFFTTVFPDYAVFKALKCEKKILIYEGLTTYYTEYWCSLYKSWAVSDFDEIFVPTIELVENPLASKYVKLDCVSYLSDKDNLKAFVDEANKVFQYCPELNRIENKYRVTFFDRDFERFVPRIFKHTAHRLTTAICAGYFNNEMMVKLHPVEQQDYVFDTFGFGTIKNNIPNELIYANMLLQQIDKQTFLIYNSSAAVNCFSIFGDDNFEIICIGDLLNQYGVGVENTLVSFQHTKGVLLKLSQTADIKVYFPKNIEDVFNIAQDKCKR